MDFSYFAFFLLQLFRDHHQVLQFLFVTCWLEKLCQTLLTHDQSTFNIFWCNCCLTAVLKLFDLISSGFFFIHNCLRDIYSMSNIHFCLPWLLDSCIPVICYMYRLLSPPFWNITVLWFNTTQIVISHICVVFSRREMSIPICTTVQLYIQCS